MISLMVKKLISILVSFLNLILSIFKLNYLNNNIEKGKILIK